LARVFTYSRRQFGAGVAALPAGMLASRLKAAAPDPTYDVLRQDRVMVPMRDGAHLATDIYYPAVAGKAAPGRFPVIMGRTPYGRDKPSARETDREGHRRSRADVAAFFVAHGYVVIFQDNRGRGDSEGRFVKYLSDGNDGYDMCRWIVAQGWSDGRIGMIGTSYEAHTQAAAACAGAPGLAALFLDFGGFSNSYQGGTRQGGAFELKQVTWAYNMGLDSPELARDPLRLAALKAVDLKAWFASMPWKRGHTPLSLLPDYEAYVYDQWQHGNFDGYWKQIGIYAAGFYPAMAQAATINLSGWYDPYSRTATENYLGLKTQRRQPTRLILGPWTHGARSTTFSGDVDFGPQSTFEECTGSDYYRYRLAYFDRFLKGRATDDATTPPVRLFVMGGGSGRRNAAGRLDHGGRWKSAADWPVPGTRFTPFYAHGDGSLTPEMPAAGARALSYDFDPKNPVPTIGGAVTSGEPVMRGGAYDQREGPNVYGSREPFLPLAARPDVLVFQTGPLDHDVEITGPIAADLWIASDCPDTDFTIKLLDIYPPSIDYPEGFEINLTTGILRCRYRDSWEKPAMMVPGKAYRIRIEGFPVSNLFKRGHRIRLDISSSNFPHFDVNPNTGEPEGAGLTTRVAKNTVFVEHGRASFVMLPLAPAAA
jgi:putative CocE/NonD family hydrolase